MQQQESSSTWLAGNTLLAQLIERETESVDVVASWEQLCFIYRDLGFTDEMTDEMKITEFKWIIKEMNKFLTRERKALESARDEESAFNLLLQDRTPRGELKLDSRKQIVFQKLRQQWFTRVLGSVHQLILTQEQEAQEEEETDEWNY